MGSALPRLGVPSSAETFDAALEGLTEVNEVILHAHPELPALYDSGVRYKVFPYDTWKNAIDINRERVGDCEGLSGWRAAELRVSGEDPAARIATYKTGRHKYHAVVLRGSGIIEDPSRVLGMPVLDPTGYRERIARNFGGDAVNDIEGENVDGAACVIGEDPTPDNQMISFDIYHSGRGWSGVIRLPMTHKGENGTAQAAFLKTSASPTKAATLPKALNLAKLALNTDVLKAAMPPQAQMALQVLQSPAGQAAVKAGMDAAKTAANLASGAASAVKKLKFW
jgi:hypothetical protein